MKLLSIVIPTYNRAKLVDAQIKWVVEEAEHYWSEIEFLVLDNNSSDETEAVCVKWIKLLGNKITVFRNDKNIGLVPNCIKGLQASSSSFVWLIGDDDPIETGLLGNVLSIIKKHKESLNLLHLNHRCVKGYNGEVVIKSFYKSDGDLYSEKDGCGVVNTLLETAYTGGFMFITANIFNRAKALDVLESSAENHKSFLAYPMYLNIRLACTGGFYYYNDIKLTCVYGESTWMEDSNELSYFQIPLFWMKLNKYGLDKKKIVSWLSKSIPGVGVDFLRFVYHSKKASSIFRLIALKFKILYWRVSTYKQ